MQKIVGVKKADDKNIYYFSHNVDLNVGDKVVANFDEFQTVATVVRIDPKIQEDKAKELKKIARVATKDDLKKYNDLQKKAKQNLKAIKTKSLELGLMMKFVGAEYSLDNSKIIITFSSEERVDFRQFLKDLASMLKTRIELKQIGQRDEVKVRGGVGPCGQPCCCARFLNDFEHVTVKMAKVQGLSLSPTKINGICGRLMCCLGYESDIYEEILSKMPKVNSEVKTANGKGTVVYNDILRERVSVKRQADGDTFVVEDFPLDEVEFPGHPAKKPEPKKEEQKPVDVVEKQVLKSEKEKAESFDKPEKQNFKNKTNNNSQAKAIATEQRQDDAQKESHGKRHHFRPKNKNKQKSYNNKNQG